MKYFVTVSKYRYGDNQPLETKNVTIDENPQVWLSRQQVKLEETMDGRYFVIDSCCPVN